ncbi:DUF5615 family PIN-like protein [Parvularcula oceani]|uniref:DUF5615 family PIN-like protein n=1 Tax=Parvularcula oceani TaxID=1247963 RepID=UPI00055B630D|nr:DUF5615 family PIN-like protein [Parvularcula oceani]
MRLFLDECLSPTLAHRLSEDGEHYAVHAIHLGRLGEPDHVVLRKCIEGDLVVVTENARDFRALVAAKEIHPGLIILPNVGRERSYQLLLAVLAHISAHGDPQDVMVNQVAEVDKEGEVILYALPSS